MEIIGFATLAGIAAAAYVITSTDLGRLIRLEIRTRLALRFLNNGRVVGSVGYQTYDEHEVEYPWHAQHAYDEEGPGGWANTNPELAARMAGLPVPNNGRSPMTDLRGIYQVTGTGSRFDGMYGTLDADHGATLHMLINNRGQLVGLTVRHDQIVKVA